MLFFWAGRGMFWLQSQPKCYLHRWSGPCCSFVESLRDSETCRHYEGTPVLYHWLSNPRGSGAGLQLWQGWGKRLEEYWCVFTFRISGMCLNHYLSFSYWNLGIEGLGYQRASLSSNNTCQVPIWPQNSWTRTFSISPHHLTHQLSFYWE